MSDLEFPIEGAGFLQPEDLRRFDLFMVGGPPGGGNTSLPELALDWDKLRALVAVAWDLDVDDPSTFVWEPGADQEIQALADDLNRRYDCSGVPLFGLATVLKLIRVTAAAARLLPVTVDDVRVRITPQHVRWAGWLIHMVYSSPYSGLPRLALRERREAQPPDEDLIEGIAHKIRQIPEGPSLAMSIAHQEYVSATRLHASLNFSVETIYDRMETFKKLGLVQSHGGRGFSATRLLTQVVSYPNEHPLGRQALLANSRRC